MWVRGMLVSLAWCIGISWAAGADDPPQVIELWPAGKVPGETKPRGEEKWLQPMPKQREVKRLTNVSQPTLTVFRPAKDKANGTAVVIAPGGGYNLLAWDLEGTEVAQWLNELGVTAFVLKYRVPRRGEQPQDQPPLAPFQDAQRAIRWVRHHAADWGIDPQRIGMLGFSAGGHLTARTATNFDKSAYEPSDAVDQTSCRPDFVLLIYPAYLTKKDSLELVPEITVTPQTPPTFLVHAADDRIPAEGSIALFLALRRQKINSELHVYSQGGHGYGLRPSSDAVSTWPRRAEAWLESLKLLGASSKK